MADLSYARRMRLSDYLGRVLDDFQFALVVDTLSAHPGIGRDTLNRIVDAFQQGREVGYQEAKLVWEGELDGA